MKKALLLLALLLTPFSAAAQTYCTPSTNITCTTNLELWVPGPNYAAWNVPVNYNWGILDADAANWAKLNTANTFTGDITAPNFIGNLTGNVSGTAAGLSGTPNISITNFAASGTISMPGIEAGSGSNCLQIDSSGNVTNTGSACAAGGSQVYPSAGIAVSTGSAWGSSLTAPSSTIVGVSDSQSLSNKSFGSGMTWPTFNQNTTGTAANLSGTPTLPTGTTLTTLLTATNCSSAASPAVCSAAAAGSVVVAAAGTTVVVDTTAVTANSQILVQEDSSLGTKLSVTCNATPATAPPTISARIAGTSFTITTTTPTTDPRCFDFVVVN